jgi:hypothetical protein
MSDPVEEFASLLDLDASTVLNAPALVLLCGGPILTKGRADPSLRALFYDRLKQSHPDLFKHLRLAEDAAAWSRTARHYDHLLHLEHDLASLSAVVLVIVESAGSIAELGVFCQTPVVRDRLVAVIEDSHQNEESFIQNGPVALLDLHNHESVLYYPWLAQGKHGRRRLERDSARTTVDHLVNWLSQRISKLPKEEKFRREDAGHRLLLICDVICLATTVRHDEIVSFLKGAGLDVPSEELGRFLFLLEKLTLIGKTQYSNNVYYLDGPASAPYIKYKFKAKGRPADRHRLRDDLKPRLRDDPDRNTAWKVYLKKGGR